VVVLAFVFSAAAIRSEFSASKPAVDSAHPLVCRTATMRNSTLTYLICELVSPQF